MDSLEDIWNAPVAPRSPPRPLFLPGDEDQEMPEAPARKTIDDTFSTVESLPDTPGHASRAHGLTPHQILSSSPAQHVDDEENGGGKDKEAKKPKKKTMRLDEGRLLGDSGFPQLIDDTKNIKIKGKGHEAADLNRLLQVYQFWTHKLYPKTPFKDTVDRVEKLCHSKRMHNMLGVWRDQAHGILDGKQGEEEEEDNDLLDLPAPGPVSDRADYTSSSPGPATRPPSSNEGTSEPDADVDMHAMDATARINAQQIGAQQQVGSAESSKELDAAILDTEKSLAVFSRAADDGGESRRASELVASPAGDDEEEMWALINESESKPSTLSTASLAKHATDDDLEEGWNMLDEIGDTKPRSPVPPPKIMPVEDDEDMYI
ncbi:replication fork protection component Swi3-domain-containing protein [Mycena polygramma]|nr:replication fork protection component Swi3-domain-containing protein [Mycena polygramma]